MNISGATSTTLNLTSVQASDAGTYIVVVTNSAGSVTSDNATLTVNVPPAITTQPASQTVSVGANVNFSVVATGSPAPTYQWKKGGTNITGATSDTLNLTNVQTSDAGNYTVVVTNVAGSVTSNTAVLTVDASLVGWWKLDETSGTTAADSSDSGFDGTLQNFSGTYWVAGHTGNALDFDGSNDRVVVGNPTVLQLTGAVTLAAWVNLDSIADSSRSIISKGGGSGARGWELLTESNNKWSFWIASNSSTLVGPSVTGVSLGTWVHVAGVYDPSVPVMRIYINGVLGAEQTTGVPTSMYNSAHDVAIGARPTSGNNVNGRIDDVRIYKRALSAAEVSAVMNSTNP
ncbi:MAG: hypothetical protein A3G75_07685 [Verrucomicrobia bacterium RIFCSPLOWO2_12_FULL_64_8]|nr:MAG: hypothetical protein A3G75_07685 [Verrucomicrobia bacterium RIFCSPLOWO2_12_FULL_64_8]